MAQIALCAALLGVLLSEVACVQGSSTVSRESYGKPVLGRHLEHYLAERVGFVPALRLPSCNCFVGSPHQRPSRLALCMSEEKQYGAASDYLKKIPADLQALVGVRNVNNKKKEYVGSVSDGSGANQHLAKKNEDIMLDDNDNSFDMTMMELEELEIDTTSFEGDIQDAAILQELRTKMHPEDFKKIFGGRQIEALVWI